MNLLIDLEIFNHPTAFWPQQFWQAMLPRLAPRLVGQQIFLLHRGDEVIDWPEAHALHLPPVDWQNPMAENRRLTQLCQQHSINYFISTGDTSCAANIHSLYVHLSHPPTDVAHAWARLTAIRLASFHFAWSQAEVDPLLHALAKPTPAIFLAHPEQDFCPRDALSWTILANYFTRCLLKMPSAMVDVAFIQSRRHFEDEIISYIL